MIIDFIIKNFFMANINCQICKTDPYVDINNPILYIYHNGIYNKSRICVKCFRKKDLFIENEQSVDIHL
jgi:hypothetical protein